MGDDGGARARAAALPGAQAVGAVLRRGRWAPAGRADRVPVADRGARRGGGRAGYQWRPGVLGGGGGDRVLVPRAAGGVGFFAVQIAVALGAHVMGTASPKNHGFLRDAGAAEVLDY